MAKSKKATFTKRMLKKNVCLTEGTLKKKGKKMEAVTESK